jgi:hypothetical protein
MPERLWQRCVGRFQMPSELGRSPVSIEAREALHYACWQ